jgi:hypothetical protein
MVRRLSSSWRRLLTSVAYTALVAVVAALAYMTFANFRSNRDVELSEGPEQSQPIELGNFSTRIEKTAKSERLVVSFKARLTSMSSLDVYVYVAARNDHSTPQIWAVWPPQPPAGAFTQGGHFRSHDPTTGYALTLVDSWQRITAPIAQARRSVPFDTVIVYVVAADGKILLARPFAL